MIGEPTQFVLKVDPDAQPTVALPPEVVTVPEDTVLPETFTSSRSALAATWLKKMPIGAAE